MKVLYYLPSSTSNKSGYGIAAAGDIKVLEGIDKIALDTSGNLGDIANSGIRYNLCIAKINPYDIISRPEILQILKKHSDKLFITFVWETDPVPNIFVSNILNNDDIDGFFCPSYFCMKLIMNNCSKPVFYFPHLVESLKIDTSIRESQEDFTVLILGQYTERKGIKDGIISYCRSIGGYPDSKLIVKYHELGKMNIPIEYEISDIVNLNSYNATKVYTISDILEYDDILKLMESSHCLLFTSRGEGFALPIPEMMATGGRVIYTDWSASSETGLSDYNIPLEYHMDEAISMIKYGYSLGLQYAVPSITSTILALQTMHREWRNDKIKFCRDGLNNIQLVNDRYGIESVTKYAKEALEKICQTL